MADRIAKKDRAKRQIAFDGFTNYCIDQVSAANNTGLIQSVTLFNARTAIEQLRHADLLEKDIGIGATLKTRMLTFALQQGDVALFRKLCDQRTLSNNRSERTLISDLKPIADKEREAYSVPTLSFFTWLSAYLKRGGCDMVQFSSIKGR